MGVVFLVRHGQASFAAADYDVLSPSGRMQSRVLGRWLAERQVRADVIVHGEMRRQRDTATELAEAAGWEAELAVDAGWNEFDHVGVLAAHRPAEPLDTAPGGAAGRREFQRLFTEAVSRWASGEHEGYAETYADFVQRSLEALARTCDRAGPGGTVVVSSSGGPIAAAVASLLEPDADALARAGLWQRLNAVIVNAAYSRVTVGATGRRLLTFNEHPHLGPELLTYR
jgi:broad specificity phosphatase PhoE